jgi:hypothetical protein
MNQSLLLVRNLLMQGEAPDEVTFWLEEVSRVMAEVLQALSEGDKPLHRHHSRSRNHPVSK